MFMKDSNQYFICFNILIGCVCLFGVVVLFVYLLLWKRNMTTEHWLSHSRCLRVVFFLVTQDSSICIQFYFEDDNSAGLTKYQLLSSLSDNVVRCYDAMVMIYDDNLMYLQNIYIYRCYYNSFLTIWLRKKIQFGVCVKSKYKKEISGHNWQIVILFDF